MKLGSLSRRFFSIGLIWMLPVCSLISCSGKVERSGEAVKRMIRAHGGVEKAKLLKNFVGRGFMKDLSSTTVAKSYPLDVYQRGDLYKTKVAKLSRGKCVDVRIALFDGKEMYQWQYVHGKGEVPEWEISIMKYKFPLVLEWIQTPGIEGKVITGSGDRGVCRLLYENGDDIVTLELDDQSWLLREVEIRSVSDTAFVYSEAYSDYREVDGVPFPSRFRGSFKGSLYYEYYISSIEYGMQLPDSIFTIMKKDTASVVKPTQANKSAESD